MKEKLKKGEVRQERKGMEREKGVGWKRERKRLR